MSIIIKTTEQIEGIRLSCQLAASTLRFIAPFVQAGVTTGYLNSLIDEFIRDHKAIPATLNYALPGRDNKFPASCCISVNEVVCHGIPGDYVIKEGDIVNIDVTTILNGYYGDTCTMFSVGKVSPEAKKLLDVTQECLKIGIKVCRPWNYFGNIGYEIAKYANQNSCSVVAQYCGHGCGLEFHEPPAVNHIAEKNTGFLMQEGMIFTIEPMICAQSAETAILEDNWTAVTVDGGLSAQYEHTILITKKGCEILTL